MKVNVLVLVLSALVLSACASGWKKPGATDVDNRRDLAACRLEGHERYRPNQSVGVNANSNNGVTVKTTDSNAQLRNLHIENCMFNKGWHY